MKKWGYLRETKEDALKAGMDKKYNIGRTGLEEYLKVIFPDVNDWIHDKTTGIILDGKKYLGRPDYRSEKLKMIVEFDGLPHYKNPDVILNDEYKNAIYEEAGYKVIRIPYFIQLSNDVAEKLFGVKVKEKLFDERIPSLSIRSRNTAAYLCPMGIRRMAIDFANISMEQYNINTDALLEEAQDEYEIAFLSGVYTLKEEMNIVQENNIK
jgi:hypothetical protein